jgi:hypothetical protein
LFALGYSPQSEWHCLVCVPLLRRNIKPIKDFQRLLDISLLHNAFSKLLCPASERMLGKFTGIDEFIQPSGDGGLRTSKYVGDFDLGLTGFVQFEDGADFSAVEAGVVGYTFCGLGAERVSNRFGLLLSSVLHSGNQERFLTPALATRS